MTVACRPVTSLIVWQTATAERKVSLGASCGRIAGRTRIEAYRETYHGIFHRYGNLETARCISCHTNHRIFVADDPRSRVHPDRIAGTCGQCHEGAGPNLSGFRAHMDPSEDRSMPVLFNTFWFMRYLVVAVIAFFGLHNLLLLLRSIPDIPRRFFRRERQEYYLRFNRFHRLIQVERLSAN